MSPLFSTLFPEAGTTEETAHVTCVPQQQRTERSVAAPAFDLHWKVACCIREAAKHLSLDCSQLTPTAVGLSPISLGKLLCGQRPWEMKCECTASNSVERQFGSCVERLLTESEANLCWPSTSLVLLAPFVWLMSECDTLPIVPLSEPHTLSTLPLSNSHEVMS